MAYVRRKQIKGRDYFYLVESYRRDGKVKTRTLKYLGRDPIYAGQQQPATAQKPVRCVQLPLL